MWEALCDNVFNQRELGIDDRQGTNAGNIQEDSDMSFMKRESCSSMSLSKGSLPWIVIPLELHDHHKACYQGSRAMAMLHLLPFTGSYSSWNNGSLTGELCLGAFQTCLSSQSGSFSLAQQVACKGLSHECLLRACLFILLRSRAGARLFCPVGRPICKNPTQFFPIGFYNSVDSILFTK